MMQITASFDTLMDQALTSTESRLYFAKKAIDHAFFEGYAEKNPQLIAAFLQVAVADLTAGVTCKILEGSLHDISDDLKIIAESLAGNEIIDGDAPPSKRILSDFFFL